MVFGGGRRLLGGRRSRTVALENVSLELERGATVGLVGESGSGKTTLGRIMAGLLEPGSGSVLFGGREVGEDDRRGRGRFRRSVQYVFQDPADSLNPRRKVRHLLSAPLAALLGMERGRREERLVGLMEEVGLRPEFLDRHPHEFSGGQGQRVVIARALAAEPEVLILDEPTSALDVSIQAQIMELLGRLQVRFGLTYLFISHDLALVEQLAGTVAVMRRGRIVERAPRERLFRSPSEDYTRRLLAAVPVPGPGN
jgi:ABC-type glutathione transport system ATPase component